MFLLPACPDCVVADVWYVDTPKIALSRPGRDRDLRIAGVESCVGLGLTLTVYVAVA